MLYDTELFSQVLRHTRAYFELEYEAGTREMIYRYVCKKMSDVPPKMISAALVVLRDDAKIIFEKRVWWSV